MSKQGGMEISEYFLRVKSICAEISEIDNEEKVSEARLRRYLIRGLRKEYGPFVTSIQGWATQPFVEELENLLSNQEALAKQLSKGLELGGGSSGDHGVMLESEAVLFSKGESYTKGEFKDKANEEERVDRNEGSPSKNTFKCYRYDKPGHNKRNCRVKLSKANVRKHLGDRVIVTADNSTYPIANEGAVNISVADDLSIKLEDVYHVPGLTKNLVSVPQITDSGKYVLFGSNDVKVLDNVRVVSGDVLLTGEKKGSMFVMSAGEAYVKKTSQTDNAAIWHARLGHVGYQMLQQISTKRLVDGMPVLKNVRKDVICQECQFGKSHRLPYKSSSTRRTSMLELVHIDLMGPTRTLSYSGHCYIMVLVDDYSRLTWVRFLKEKKEALSKFVEFKEAVEKEFGKKIQCLRSDNGGEFMSDDFFKYCNSNGIMRQMICPDTPQQNGVIERKIAHLVSVYLSWLHDKGLPRALWAEAIQCACHVTNRLPSWPGRMNHLLTMKEKRIVFQDDQLQEVRRSSRDRKHPDYLKDYEVEMNSCSITSCFLLEGLNSDEPTSYEVARRCPDWESAMREEIEAIYKNETWELVPRPEG
ncbi:Retrovirus-related Pol polyprotein from transposon TNT 1-94-like protein [Drosera capensis]